MRVCYRSGAPAAAPAPAASSAGCIAEPEVVWKRGRRCGREAGDVEERQEMGAMQKMEGWKSRRSAMWKRCRRCWQCDVGDVRKGWTKAGLQKAGER
eukprot:gene14484-biopygen12572